MKPSEVRRIRARLKLTQEEFARLLGFSRPTITRWENGSLRMSRPHAELIRLKLQVAGQ